MGMVTMQKAICSGLVAVAFALSAPAQDWKSAVEFLSKYEFGQSRTALVPLHDAIREAGGDAKKLKPIAEALAGVISGGASAEAKREALRALGPIATAAQVPAIAALAADPNVGDTAVWALERVSDPAAGKALLDALSKAPAENKAALALALGWRRDADATGALVKLLTADEATAAAAAKALARIGGDEACGAAATARGTANGKAKDELTNLALICAEQALTAGDAAGAIAAYEALAGEGEPGHVRAAALNGLVKAQPEKALERVVQAFTSKDADLALVAAGFVRELKGDGATAAFAGLLAEAPPATKIILIDALADRGDASAHDAVAAAADSDDPAIKIAAVKALGRLGNAGDTARLAGLAADASGELKRAAQTSLNVLPGDGVDRALGELAAGGELKLRSAAITALAERRAFGAREGLLKLLDDPEAALRADVYAALEILCDASDIPALLKRLFLPPDAKDIAALEKVLTAVCSRIPAEAERVKAIAAELKQAQGTEYRASLIRVLGGVPTADSLAALREALGTDDQRVRMVATQALAAWPGTEPLADLAVIAQEPPSEDERAAALAGFVRIVREAKEMPQGEAIQQYEVALKLAKSAAERQQAVAGLATLPSMRALELIEAQLADPEMANAVATGVVGGARLISGAYPAIAKAKIERFSGTDAPEAVKKAGAAALALIAAFEDYITGWEVAGPYSQAGTSGRDLFNVPFAPEKGEAAEWRIAPLANTGNSAQLKPWAVDLDAIIGGQERVAYLRTKITAGSAAEGVLEVGSNDGCKVWLNGKLLHGFKEGRPLVPGEDKLPVTLNTGKNDLLIAVYQHGGGWAACARLVGKDGKPLEGVTTGIE